MTSDKITEAEKVRENSYQVARQYCYNTIEAAWVVFEQKRDEARTLFEQTYEKARRQHDLDFSSADKTYQEAIK